MASDRIDPRMAPILVTGGHRTGTTWVGRMLAANPRVAYISEPLNVLHRPGVLRAGMDHWYQYVCEDNESMYHTAFEELLDYRYHTWDEIRSIRSLKDLLRMGRDFAIFYNGLMRGQRALLKDPFAVFSIPWFTRRYNFNVIVTVRHPAAFASSLKRLGWKFDFKNLLDQPLLMRDRLDPFRDQMQSIEPDDVIGQASLLWTMIYKTVHSCRSLIPNLIVVRHEVLSRDPIPGFRDLYESLGLEFSSSVEKRILNSSGIGNPAEVSKKRVHSVQLDSRANMDNWKKRLTGEEINRVLEMTRDVLPLYYPESI